MFSRKFCSDFYILLKFIQPYRPVNIYNTVFRLIFDYKFPHTFRGILLYDGAGPFAISVGGPNYMEVNLQLVCTGPRGPGSMGAECIAVSQLQIFICGFLLLKLFLWLVLCFFF